ncbi:Variant surface glycoprotein [Trypanosoma congolense IL3000]|uniref:Variant surface glycoprotein n=1 Tax=Trypanosoma congolense (strain IL3000) TaxID=1068625 RepID=F9WA68_TRYCI|nr:Variant surface glycoprotein [Trypanosoma congolense IL3000]
MLRKFELVGLVFCAGIVCGQHPSAAEFNLFCRILMEANNMMYGPDYVYDENTDREAIKEMTVLYNATTDDVNEFRKTLWDTKDFFEEHPPPTDAKNRQAAHREIEQLIKEGQEKVEENKKIALEVNEEINEAKLSVAKGISVDELKELPKQNGNLKKILKKPESIFNDHNSATTSCWGNEKDTAGKTLLNDFFASACGMLGNKLKDHAHPYSTTKQ